MSRHHIALPKSSLLRFSDNGTIHYLDLVTNKIERAYASSYNTKENYYLDETEKFLNSEVEAVLGRLYKSIDSFEKSKGMFIYPEGIDYRLKVILGIQQLRPPDIINEVKLKVIYCQFINAPDTFFSPLHHGPEFALENMSNFLDSLESYELNFFYIDRPNCSLDFLLPTFHSYVCGNCYYFVLSPTYSIMLLPKEINNKLRYDKNKLKYICAKSDREIIEMYTYIIKSERTCKCPRLIGSLKSLEIARDINSENKL